MKKDKEVKEEVCIYCSEACLFRLSLELRPDRGFIYKIKRPFPTYEDAGNKPVMVPEQWSSGSLCAQNPDSSSAILPDPCRSFLRILNTMYQTGILVPPLKFIMHDKGNY